MYKWGKLVWIVSHVGNDLLAQLRSSHFQTCAEDCRVELTAAVTWDTLNAEANGTQVLCQAA